MQRIVHTGTVPHGGVWRYKDTETGEIITHPYLDQVRMRAHKHRTSNNLPIPTNWEEQFEDNVCEHTQSADCEPIEKGLRQAALLAKRFARAMTSWAKSGFKLVDDETLRERKDTCQGNVEKNIPRCQWFSNNTRYFGFGRCMVCGCNSGLRTPLATEVCKKGKWKR